MAKVLVEVHYYDCKGRQYRLDNLAQSLRSMGIEVNRTGFESDYDGYVECMVTKPQFVTLHRKWANRLHAIGADFGGYTEDPNQMFENCLKEEQWISNFLKRKKN